MDINDYINSFGSEGSNLAGPTPAEKNTDEAWEPDFWTGFKARAQRAGEGRYGEAFDFSKDVRIPEEEQSFASHIPGVGALSSLINVGRAVAGPGAMEWGYKKSLGVDEAAPFSWTDIPQMGSLPDPTRPGITGIDLTPNPMQASLYEQALQAYKAGDIDTAHQLMRQFRAEGGFSGAAMKAASGVITDPTMAIPFGAAGKTAGTLAAAAMAPEMAEGTIRGGMQYAKTGMEKGFTSGEAMSELPEVLTSAGFLGAMGYHHAGDIKAGRDWLKARTARPTEANLSTADAAMESPLPKREAQDPTTPLADELFDVQSQVKEIPPELEQHIMTALERSTNILNEGARRAARPAAEFVEQGQEIPSGAERLFFSEGETPTQAKIVQATPEVIEQLASQYPDPAAKKAELENLDAFTAGDSIFITKQAVKKLLRAKTPQEVQDNILKMLSHEGGHAISAGVKDIGKLPVAYDPMTGAEVTGEAARRSGAGHAGPEGRPGDVMLPDVGHEARAQAIESLLREHPGMKGILEELANNPQLLESLYEPGTQLGAGTHLPAVVSMAEAATGKGTAPGGKRMKIEELAGEMAEPSPEGGPEVAGMGRKTEGEADPTWVSYLAKKLAPLPPKNRPAAAKEIVKSWIAKKHIHPDVESDLKAKAIAQAKGEHKPELQLARAKKTAEEGGVGFEPIKTLETDTEVSVPELEGRQAETLGRELTEKITPPPGHPIQGPPEPKRAGVPRPTPTGAGSVDKALERGTRWKSPKYEDYDALITDVEKLGGFNNAVKSGKYTVKELGSAYQRVISSTNPDFLPLKARVTSPKFRQSARGSRAAGTNQRTTEALLEAARTGSDIPIANLPKSSQEGLDPRIAVRANQGLSVDFRSRAREAMATNSPQTMRQLAEQLRTNHNTAKSRIRKLFDRLTGARQSDVERNEVARENIIKSLITRAEILEKRQAKSEKRTEQKTQEQRLREQLDEAKKQLESLQRAAGLPARKAPEPAPREAEAQTSEEFEDALAAFEKDDEISGMGRRLTAKEAEAEAKKAVEEATARKARLEAELKEMKRKQAIADTRSIAARTEDVFKGKGSRSAVVVQKGEVKREKRRVDVAKKKGRLNLVQGRKVVWDQEAGEYVPIAPPKKQKGVETALVDADAGEVRQLKPEEIGPKGIRVPALSGEARERHAAVQEALERAGGRMGSEPAPRYRRAAEPGQVDLGTRRYQKQGKPGELPIPPRPLRKGLDEAQLLVEKYLGREAKDIKGKIKGAGIMERVKDAREIAEALGPKNPEALPNWDVLPEELRTAIRRAYNAKQATKAPEVATEKKLGPTRPTSKTSVTSPFKINKTPKEIEAFRKAQARLEAVEKKLADVRREQARTKTGPFTPGEEKQGWVPLTEGPVTKVEPKKIKWQYIREMARRAFLQNRGTRAHKEFLDVSTVGKTLVNNLNIVARDMIKGNEGKAPTRKQYYELDALRNKMVDNAVKNKDISLETANRLRTVPISELKNVIEHAEAMTVAIGNKQRAGTRVETIDKNKYVEDTLKEIDNEMDKFLSEIDTSFLHSKAEAKKDKAIAALDDLNEIIEGSDVKGMAKFGLDTNTEYIFDVQRYRRWRAGLKDQIARDFEAEQDQGLERTSAGEYNDTYITNLLKDLPALPEQTRPAGTRIRMTARGHMPSTRRISEGEQFIVDTLVKQGITPDKTHGIRKPPADTLKTESFETFEGTSRRPDRALFSAPPRVGKAKTGASKRPGFEASLRQIGEEGGRIMSKETRVAAPPTEKAAGESKKAVEEMVEAEEHPTFGTVPRDPFRESSLGRAQRLAGRVEVTSELGEALQALNASSKEAFSTEWAPRIGKGKAPTKIAPKIRVNLVEATGKVVSIAKTAETAGEGVRRIEDLAQDMIDNGQLAAGEPEKAFIKSMTKYFRRKARDMGRPFAAKMAPEETQLARGAYEQRAETPRQRAERLLAPKEIEGMGSISQARKKTVYEQAGEEEFKKKPAPLNEREVLLNDSLNTLEKIGSGLKMGITGGDVSSVLRQTLALTSRAAIHEPRFLMKTLKDSIYSYSESYHDKVRKAFEKDPDYQNAVDAGLRLNRDLADNDHFQASNYIAHALNKLRRHKSLPVRLVGELGEKYAIGANRAYTHYQNKVMLNAWKHGRNLLQKNKKLNVTSTRELTDMINMFGSRSKVRNEAVARIGNLATFSSQMIKSNLKMLGNIGLPFEKGVPEILKPAISGGRKYSTPEVRQFGHEHARDTVMFASSILGLTYMAAAAAGLNPTIETDARSTDFAKVRFGTTTVNPLGPLQGYIRAGAQIVTGQEKLRGSGRVQKANRAEVVARLFRGKLSPLAGLAWTLFTGKTGAGREAETAQGKVNAILETVTPMMGSDMSGIITSHPDAMAPYLATLAALGVAVQTGSPGKPWITSGEERETDIRVSEEIRRLKIEPPRVGTRVPLPGRNPLGQRHYYSLSGAEREQFETEVMPIISKDLDDFIKSERYQKLPDEQKRRVLYNFIKRENARYSTSKRLRKQYVGAKPVNEWWD